MSGEGMIAARPEGMPNEHSRSERLPGVVTRLCADGQWRVWLLVPVGGAYIDPLGLEPEQAERLGRELLEYAALVRDKRGLPAGAPYP